MIGDHGLEPLFNNDVADTDGLKKNLRVSVKPAISSDMISLQFSHTDVSTAQELVAASVGNKVYIKSLIISVDTASSYWLEDETQKAVSGIFYFAANGGVAMSWGPGDALVTPEANKSLKIKSAGTGKVGITMTYYLAS